MRYDPVERVRLPMTETRSPPITTNNYISRLRISSVPLPLAVRPRILHGRRLFRVEREGKRRIRFSTANFSVRDLPPASIAAV